MKYIPSLSITYAKIKCTFLRKTYSCMCGSQAYDDKYVLSQTQKWVIQEVITNSSMQDKEKVYYLIHKCEKNGLSLPECLFLLHIFDLHRVVGDLFDDGCDCDICKRLRQYNEAK